MKLTLQLQLLPDASTAARLYETVERFNEAADWLAGVAFERRLANKFALQKTSYAKLRERFGLPADTAIRCLAQVVEAYKRDKNKRPHFRKHAAVPFSMNKNISFKGVDRVSISTLKGRVIVPYIMGKYQTERFGWSKGQCDLVLRKDGKWFLLVTVDVPDGAPIRVTDFIGVDLGVCAIAADSDGGKYSGDKTESIRQRYANRRKTLGQAAGARQRRDKRARSIHRAVQRQHQREARFRKDTNHVISKRLVAKAKDTQRGIGLEDLKGVRDRVEHQFRKRQRARISGWAFFQLRAFIEYKSRLAGVPVIFIDPRNTSRTCSDCGHCEKANRKSQSEFVCLACGFTLQADTNAARNIRARAVVNWLMVSEQHSDLRTA
jgi:IS605 OrfB family transposase